jgi:D-threo-aldose 1-dehydrogenase
MTQLGLGAAQFGNLYRVTSQEECEAAFNVAWDNGVRYFDTAPHYGLGLSESRLGSLLRGKPRGEFTLSTKVGRTLVPNPGGEGRFDDEGFVVPATTRREWDFSADGVRRSLESSLERLGLDYVDIVYLHDPDDFFDDAATKAIPALISLRDQGVVGAIGAGMNQAEMLTEFVRKCDIDVVMCAGRYTLLEQNALQDLLPAALENKVSVVAAGIYNSGLLSTRRPQEGAKYNYETVAPELLQRAWRIADVCELHGVSLPEAALAFPLLHPAVTSIVVGIRNGQQAEQTLERFSTRIPAALWLELEDEGLITRG